MSVVFGLDYAHQAIVASEIADLMKDELEEGLVSKGVDELVTHLAVEFKLAGASSLDLEIIADFVGRAAENFQSLERLINRLALESCNRHDWGIPFTQVTIHQA